MSFVPPSACVGAGAPGGGGVAVSLSGGVFPRRPSRRRLLRPCARAGPPIHPEAFIFVEDAPFAPQDGPSPRPPQSPILGLNAAGGKKLRCFKNQHVFNGDSKVNLLKHIAYGLG